MNSDKNKIFNLDELSLDVYGDKEFVKNYASRIEYNAHNALYERPATLSLIPDVRNKSVLDAGCGPGNYTEWLLDKGAKVTAIDFSDEMIRMTNEKAEGKARVLKMNLNLPFKELGDQEFDVILSSLVIHYIKDWNTLFSEFNRVLKKEGELILSTHHPMIDFDPAAEGSYYDTELLSLRWPSYNIVMSFYRRPLSEIFNSLRDAELRITEVLEPKPLAECREKFPDAYDELSKQPPFIFFKAIKEK